MGRLLPSVGDADAPRGTVILAYAHRSSRLNSDFSPAVCCNSPA